MATALAASVTCPSCRRLFVAQVHQIIDGGKEPELKRALLEGRLNVARCPYCGNSGLLSTPLVYHDAGKELLLVYLPQQLTLKVEEREKLIGGLVNAVINSVPTEQRKAYLLQPKTIFSLERLMEEILVGDGISRETIEAQRKAIALLQELLVVKDNEESLKSLVEQHREELNYEFFLLLSASIEAAQRDGDAEQARQMETLRAKLLDLIVPSIPEPLGEGATRQDLIAKLLEAKKEEEIVGLVISNRPMVDYIFFQTLTGQIEDAEKAGETEKAKRLRELRSKVLDITDRLEKEAREAEQEIAALIQELLNSGEQEKAIAEHAREYDAFFISVLLRMIASAQRAGDKEQAAKLRELYERILDFLEERLPPELRLLNQLLGADEPEKRRVLLEEHADQVNDNFVEMLKELGADLGKQRPELQSKLQAILDQVNAFRRERAES